MCWYSRFQCQFSCKVSFSCCRNFCNIHAETQIKTDPVTLSRYAWLTDYHSKIENKKSGTFRMSANRWKGQWGGGDQEAHKTTETCGRWKKILESQTKRKKAREEKMKMEHTKNRNEWSNEEEKETVNCENQVTRTDLTTLAMNVVLGDDAHGTLSSWWTHFAAGQGNHALLLHIVSRRLGRHPHPGNCVVRIWVITTKSSYCQSKKHSWNRIIKNWDYVLLEVVAIRMGMKEESRKFD